MLAGAFGEDKVLGAVAIVAGERPEPGVVNWTYDGSTHFGELAGQKSERVDWIVDLWRQAGFIAQSSDSILSATWAKMIGWVPLGLLAVLSRQNNAGVLSASPHLDFRILVDADGSSGAAWRHDRARGDEAVGCELDLRVFDDARVGARIDAQVLDSRGVSAVCPQMVALRPVDAVQDVARRLGGVGMVLHGAGLFVNWT